MSNELPFDAQKTRNYTLGLLLLLLLQNHKLPRPCSLAETRKHRSHFTSPSKSHTGLSTWWKLSYLCNSGHKGGNPENVDLLSNLYHAVRLDVIGIGMESMIFAPGYKTGSEKTSQEATIVILSDDGGLDHSGKSKSIKKFTQKIQIVYRLGHG